MTEVEKYDLVVVGTGFASSFFLKRYLHNCRGEVKVLVLERGNRYPHAERVAAKKQSIRSLHAVTNGMDTIISEEKEWGFEPNFGGGSNCWWGCTPRFMPGDFKLKTNYGQGEDWPIDYQELEPYYEEAERIMMISGPDGTPYPMSSPYPLPAHDLSTVDKLIQAEYGHLYISQPTARASSPVRNRAKCCSNVVCSLCPVDAKFTIENSLDHLYQDSRVEVIYGAQVVSLDLVQNIARSVTYRIGEIEYKAGADLVALGANAIFNAHILLNSGDTNPYTGVGITEQAGLYANFYYDGLDNFIGTSAITANGFMLYDGEHRKDHAGCLIESSNGVVIRNEKNKWRQISTFKFIFEDIPKSDNKVTSTENPLVPKIEFTGYSDYLLKGVEAVKNNIERSFGFLPIERIEFNNRLEKTESHICSTTRMSQLEQNGVVDKSLVHHKYRNLLVLGSGVYPVTSPANPTLTISALSLYAADRLTI